LAKTEGGATIAPPLLNKERTNMAENKPASAAQPPKKEEAGKPIVAGPPKVDIEAVKAKLTPLIKHLQELRAANGLDSQKESLLEAAEAGMALLE
jgi:hypothetical protein